MTYQNRQQDQAISEAQERLKRLEERKIQLQDKARQFRERAKDAEGLIDAGEKRIRRQQETREKVHMGALVRMVGLDRFRLPSEQHLDNQRLPIDVDLLIGALLTLSEQLEVVERTTSEQFDELRRKGAALRAIKPLWRKVPGRV